MVKTWRDNAKAAAYLVRDAIDCQSSWVDLLMADAKLQGAKEAIGSALTRLNAIPTVIEAKKHVQITSNGGNKNGRGK
jgi:hypothetical protein